MNGDYIQSSCGLYNGVRFEELQIDSFYKDSTPKIYKVVLAIEGHLNESKVKASDRIYFNGSTCSCTWWTDTTTNGLYNNFGVQREHLNKTQPVSTDSS